MKLAGLLGIVAAWALAANAADLHAAAAQGPATAQCRSVAVLERNLAELARPNAEVRDAIERIDGVDRKLLAMRSYLRAQDSLASRWSWKQDQIDAYRQSDQYRDM